MRVTLGVSLFLIASCVAVCLVGADREYDPPSPPRGPSVPASSSDALSQLLNDSKLSRLLDDPDLWLILKKRLGGGGDDEDRCSADRKTNNTIIKTKDSLDAGAVFIAAPSVANYRDCENECCKEETCNTAVVNLKESKNGQSEGIACYLFDCKSPSVCVFTPHPGFIVMQFGSKKSIDSQADELSKLVSSTSISSSTTTTSPTAASSTTVTTKARQTENNARKYRVGLFSECVKSSDCKDQNTYCLSGYCICQRNYHAVEMQCRKDCDQELEFECSNKNSPLFSECIAVYDYCDGVAQCSDGSDESSCLESSRHKGGGHPGGQDRGRLQSNEANSSSTVAVQVVSLPVPTTTTTDRAVAVGSTTVVLPSERIGSVVEGERTSNAPKVSPTHLELASVDQKQTSPQDAHDEIKQEKIERSFWRMEKNHGAIVALVLGIVLMTVLLILAGCRLRHFRKRYRKGRHLNSNEADYLINGMYL